VHTSRPSDPTLPFTGLNVWLIAALGALMLVTGFVARQAMSRRA
jgi:hypothetical protein